MKATFNDPAEFANLLQRFFTERLSQQQAASSKTVAAYRDAFRLLLGYAESKLGKAPVKLALEDFNVELVLGFLTYLEAERHNSVRSRNARLAALRAFARYISMQCPQALSLVQQIVAIPMKRHERPMLGFETLTLAPLDLALVEPKLLDADEIAWLDDYHARVRKTLSPLVDAPTRRWLTQVTRRLAAANRRTRLEPARVEGRSRALGNAETG